MQKAAMPSPKGKEMSQSGLAGSWNVRGYPTIVLINADMTNVENKPGYRKPAGFISMLRSFAN